MQECLLKLLVFLGALGIFNTIVNVLNKLTLLDGPPTRVAQAVLSIIILFGYTGVLNTVFLKRRFMTGRLIFMVFAITCQLIILTLAILSWTQVMTYFLVNAIIHALFGFIVTVGFVAAVLCMEQQRQEIQSVDQKNNKQLMMKRIQAIDFYYRRKQEQKERVSREQQNSLLDKQDGINYGLLLSKEKEIQMKPIRKESEEKVYKTRQIQQ